MHIIAIDLAFKIYGGVIDLCRSAVVVDFIDRCEAAYRDVSLDYGIFDTHGRRAVGFSIRKSDACLIGSHSFR